MSARLGDNAPGATKAREIYQVSGIFSDLLVGAQAFQQRNIIAYGHKFYQSFLDLSSFVPDEHYPEQDGADH